MAGDPTRLYRGQGVLNIAERNAQGKPTGYIDIGNCEAVSVGTTTERIEHKEKRTGKQFTDKVIEKMIDGEVTFEVESIAKENLEKFYYGTSTVLNSVTVTDEVIICYKGKKGKLSRINLSTFVSLTDSSGTVTYTRNLGSDPDINITSFDDSSETFNAVGHGFSNGNLVKLKASTMPTGFNTTTNYYVVGTTANSFQLSLTPGGTPVNGTTAGSGVIAIFQYDYEINLKTGVITFNKDGAIPEGEGCKADYTAGASEKVAAFTRTNKELTLLFEGINTAEDDKPVVLTIFKVRLDPPSEWQLISDEFSKLSIKGKILYDSAQPDNTVDGRWFKEEQVVAA